MPIPNFNCNGVIPPHNGNPVQPADVSPFRATTLELCQKLATSAERRTILQGFIGYRTALRQFGISSGFHWIDGSFTEDVERLRGRAPGDIDVVTFFHLPPPPVSTTPEQQQIQAILSNEIATKQHFHVHHQLVNLSWESGVIIECTRYWCGLFSHQRETEVWKGMLRIDLCTPAEDVAAIEYLAAFEPT